MRFRCNGTLITLITLINQTMPQRVPVTKKFLVRSPAYGNDLLVGLSLRSEERIGVGLYEVAEEQLEKKKKLTLRGLVKEYLRRLLK